VIIPYIWDIISIPLHCDTPCDCHWCRSLGAKGKAMVSKAALRGHSSHDEPAKASGDDPDDVPRGSSCGPRRQRQFPSAAEEAAAPISSHGVRILETQNVRRQRGPSHHLLRGLHPPGLVVMYMARNTPFAQGLAARITWKRQAHDKLPDGTLSSGS